MTAKNHTFPAQFQKWRQKLSAFRNHEIEALTTILTSVIKNPIFSLNRIAKEANHQFSRNHLAKCQMKYAYVLQKLTVQLVAKIVRSFSKKTSVLIVLDDTLVKKCGKHIHGVYARFDHSYGRVVTSLCRVNVSLVVDDRLLCMIPWILRKPQTVFYRQGKISKGQDKKILATIELI